MALLWAGGLIAGKLIASQAGPFTISFLRFLVATFVLAALVHRRGENRVIPGGVLIYAFIAAFFGVFCYNYLFFSGIKLIEASRGSVIISMVPIVIALFSYIVFREKMNFIKVIGIVLSVLGASIVVSKGELASIFGKALGLGEIYLVLCVFCAATFTLLSKKLLQALTPLVTMTMISAIGTCFLFGPALLEISQIQNSPVSYTFFLNLLYLAIGPSVIAVTFYYEAICVVGPSRASQYMNLMPVFAVVLAFIFLGENVTTSLMLGGGLVTTGLYVTNITS